MVSPVDWIAGVVHVVETPILGSPMTASRLLSASGGRRRLALAAAFKWAHMSVNRAEALQRKQQGEGDDEQEATSASASADAAFVGGARAIDAHDALVTDETQFDAKRVIGGSEIGAAADQQGRTVAAVTTANKSAVEQTAPAQVVEDLGDDGDAAAAAAARRRSKTLRAKAALLDAAALATSGRSVVSEYVSRFWDVMLTAVAASPPPHSSPATIAVGHRALFIVLAARQSAVENLRECAMRSSATLFPLGAATDYAASRSTAAAGDDWYERLPADCKELIEREITSACQCGEVPGDTHATLRVQFTSQTAWNPWAGMATQPHVNSGLSKVMMSHVDGGDDQQEEAVVVDDEEEPKEDVASPVAVAPPASSQPAAAFVDSVQPIPTPPRPAAAQRSGGPITMTAADTFYHPPMAMAIFTVRRITHAQRGDTTDGHRAMYSVSAGDAGDAPPPCSHRWTAAFFTDSEEQPRPLTSSWPVFVTDMTWTSSLPANT